VVVYFILRKKRIEDEKKRVEAELLKPLPSQMMDASDVRYFPGGAGGPGATGPAQLPSVTLPGGAQAQQYPYGAGTADLPQLPPAQAADATTYAQQPYQQPYQQPSVIPQQQVVPSYTSPEQAPLGQPPVQPQPQPYQQQVQPQAQELHFKMPQPTEPVAVTETQTSGAPVQVPYIPKTKPAVEDAERPIGTQNGAPQAQETPGTAEQTPAQLMDTLKAKYLKGTVSEDIYMTLKKELKDLNLSGGKPDNSVIGFIQGSITEDEFKRQRGL